MKDDRKICAICGKGDAITNEHIPPKAIFIKPRPSDLITVPACSKCNNGTAKEDERFKVFLSFIVGEQEEKTRRYFDKNVLPTLDHSVGLKKRILNRSEEVDLSTPTGILYGKTGKIEIERHCFDVVINKCIRGLYYKHYQEVLDKEVLLSVSYRTSLSDSAYEEGMKLRGENVGDGTFVYKYARGLDAPCESIWYLQFYNRFWAIVSTTKNT